MLSIHFAIVLIGNLLFVTNCVCRSSTNGDCSPSMRSLAVLVMDGLEHCQTALQYVLGLLSAFTFVGWWWWWCRYNLIGQIRSVMQTAFIDDEHNYPLNTIDLNVISINVQTWTKSTHRPWSTDGIKLCSHHWSSSSFCLPIVIWFIHNCSCQRDHVRNIYSINWLINSQKLFISFGRVIAKSFECKLSHWYIVEHIDDQQFELLSYAIWNTWRM